MLHLVPILGDAHMTVQMFLKLPHPYLTNFAYNFVQVQPHTKANIENVARIYSLLIGKTLSVFYNCSPNILSCIFSFYVSGDDLSKLSHLCDFLKSESKMC